LTSKKQPKGKKNKEHVLKFCAKTILAGAIAVCCLLFCIVNFYTPASIEIVKTFVEVIATLMGLFGVFAIYRISSYDNRISRLRDKIEDYRTTIDCKKKQWKQVNLELEEACLKNCKDRQQKLINRRQKSALIIWLTTISLMIAFGSSFGLLYVLYLDAPNVINLRLMFHLNSTIPSKQIIATTASISLTIGVSLICWLVYNINDEYWEASREFDKNDSKTNNNVNKEYAPY